MATKKTTTTTTKKITEPEPLPIDTSDDETPVEVPRKKAVQVSAADELLALAEIFSKIAAERRANASKSNGIGAHVENVVAETMDAVVAKIRARAAEL